MTTATFDQALDGISGLSATLPSIHRHIAFVFALVCACANAEVVLDVAPYDSMGEVKQKYPSATLERVNPAWAGESEAIYEFSGQGLPGALIIDFIDPRANYRRKLSEAASAASAAGKVPDDDPVLQELAGQPDNDALVVDWTRWIPLRPIPFSSYRQKYGQPSKCGFDDWSMKPFCRWDARALTANLTDDRSSVISVQTDFTRSEKRNGWRKKHPTGDIPEWLIDPKPVSKPHAPPLKAKPQSTVL